VEAALKPYLKQNADCVHGTNTSGFEHGESYNETTGGDNEKSCFIGISEFALRFFSDFLYYYVPVFMTSQEKGVSTKFAGNWKLAFFIDKKTRPGR
jgi:hypothetical protein